MLIMKSLFNDEVGDKANISEGKTSTLSGMDREPPRFYYWCGRDYNGQLINLIPGSSCVHIFRESYCSPTGTLLSRNDRGTIQIFR